MRNAEHYKRLTTSALEAKKSKEQQAAVAMLADLEPLIDAAASAGKSSIDYKKHLNDHAVEQLRAQGFKIDDRGENVTSDWHISWM